MLSNKNTVVKKLAYLAVAFALVLLVSSITWAQAPADTFKVNYFDNNGTGPDGIVHILNPGTSGSTLCATIYVFRANQELEECCSIPITVNGLLTLDVLVDLTSNPGDGGVVAQPNGEIAIVSDSACNPAAPVPTPSLRAWTTHANVDNLTSGFDVTETEFSDTTLSAAELTEASTICGIFEVNSTGHGICFSDSTGAKRTAKK